MFTKVVSYTEIRGIISPITNLIQEGKVCMKNLEIRESFKGITSTTRTVFNWSSDFESTSIASENRGFRIWRTVRDINEEGQCGQ